MPLFPRNRRSRGNPPRPVGPPLQGGEQNIPSREGWPKAGVGSSPARQTTPSFSHLTRFLTCRRGTVALESAIAVIPLIICLVGIFEIVQSAFTGDLIQRAAYRVAYASASSAGVKAAIAAGLAVGVLGRSTLPAGCRALTRAEGFDDLPGSNLLLRCHSESPAAEGMAAAIRESFRAVGD